MSYFVAFGAAKIDQFGNRLPHIICAVPEHILRCNTLEEAREKRMVSSDLVWEEATGKIVKDPGWLFDWERKDPNAYAQQMILCAARLLIVPPRRR